MRVWDAQTLEKKHENHIGIRFYMGQDPEQKVRESCGGEVERVFV